MYADASLHSPASNGTHIGSPTVSQPDVIIGDTSKKMRYQFLSDEHCEKNLRFKYFGQKSHFTLLTESRLEKIASEPHSVITKTDLIQFLNKLGIQWYEFITNELRVPGNYLEEFIHHDFSESVLSRLNEELQSSEDRDDPLKAREDFVAQYSPDLRRHASHLTETSRMKRIAFLCEKQFDYFDDPATAKRDCLRILLGLPDERGTLERQSLDSLAEILTYLNNSILCEKMRAVIENPDFEVTAHSFSKELRRRLGFRADFQDSEGLSIYEN